MKRKITGVQLHHKINLDDASRFGVNMLTALYSTYKRTDDPRYLALYDQLREGVRTIGALGREADERFRSFQSHPDFKDMVEGDLPWPDETAEDFEARCRCHDRCLYHDVGQGTEDNCNCHQQCVRHG